MKKILSLLVMMVSVFGIASAADQIVYNDSPLPAQAKSLLANHFKAKVNFVKIDKNLLGNVEDYEVVLKNGTEVEFRANGELKSVDAGSNGVPSSLLLKDITNYVKKNCKNQKIVELDIEKNHYKIELQDGRELKFDRNGTFVSESR